MSYEQLAYVYDKLMEEAPYDRWVRFLKENKDRWKAPGVRVLDLGCGTGEMAILLMKEGFHVSGVDLSEDMLAVAAEKAENEGLILPLYHQDMSELEGLPEYDIITIFCDSLNYLPTPEKVKKTFRAAHEHLVSGGLLLFDVHSVYQMDQGFAHQTFTLNEDNVAYIWDAYPGEEPCSAEHAITFFVLDERTGQYQRMDELHKQRTYLLQDYQEWLMEAGFEILSVTADFSGQPPDETSRRLFFTCRKK
ncbi:class I SAM-dependent DNA methyltransferase [Siminovitchia sediminis]|uniref:Class I SAM-dependent DNA methyltransferase n=1 Tax=Siminovitchia sediminis TaxID=1274353 RepID=A0ABW4KEH7_9BACI